MLDISNEYTFKVSIVGERSKKTYEGQFTVKCVLNYQEQVNVGLLLDEYNRGSRTVPEGTFRMNRALAEMDVRVVIDDRTGQQKAPSWWRDSNGGRTMIDKNVVLEVFLKALDAETDYDKRVEESSKDAEESVEKQTKKAKASKEA
jgi:hypothetical protein